MKTSPIVRLLGFDMRRILVALAAALLLISPALPQSSAGGSGGGGGGGGGPATQSGTWTVGLNGTLPAFASTPTFNIGTIAGIATDTSVQQVKTALGSPFQAGGSIGNTAFGISGTLPAFAATPTFNLGTLNGAATAANQSSQIAALGTPSDTSWTGTGNASVIAALKSIFNTLIAPTPAGTNIIGKVSSGVTPTDINGTLGANAGALLLSANANRQFLAITNNGANSMLYRFSSTGPSLTLGHTLAAGATVVFDAKVPTSAITGVSQTGTTYTITEGQ